MTHIPASRRRPNPASLLASQAMEATGVRPDVLGIANQTETFVVWDRGTGEAVHPAIVWQDRRTDAACEALREHAAWVRERTGLELDATFPATKLRWVLDRAQGDLAYGDVASWLLHRLAGVHVTGVTLSTEQQKVAQDRARAAGIADKVRFHLRDYREESGTYDRIVSVGMFEHVGAAHYREFFAKARDLLTEDGVMLLHSIGRMEPPGGTNPWLRKYIFPGGYTPALSEVFAAAERVGLWVTDVEVLRLHYAATLREWRRRFESNRDKIRAIYDERFCRMWEFYLVGCELSFRHLGQMVFQMQLSRRLDTVPLTRDYIAEFERHHAGRAMSAA